MCDELYYMNEFIGNNCAMFFTNATIEFTWLNDGSGKSVSKNRTSISLKTKWRLRINIGLHDLKYRIKGGTLHS